MDMTLSVYLTISSNLVVSTGDFAFEGHLQYLETFLIVTTQDRVGCALGI